MSQWEGSEERAGFETATEPSENDIEILSIEGESESDAEPASSSAAAVTGEGSSTSETEPSALSQPGHSERRKFEELESRHLRLLADFDNFRKRVDRELEEARRRGLTEALSELLPVIDNLERALAAAAEGSSVGELLRGVELILRQLGDALRRLGVTPVPGVGTRFNPEVHEAIAQEPSSSVSESTVVAEFRRGYQLGERLLRPALVRVAVPTSGAVTSASPPERADSGESA